MTMKKVESIKNCDRNGPEGQSITVGSTMCNAGLPSYSKVFVISLEPIKVSMKKKEERKWEKWSGERRIYTKQIWSVRIGKFVEFALVHRPSSTDGAPLLSRVIPSSLANYEIVKDNIDNDGE